MRSSTDRFVTQMKLAELRRQREKLRRAYRTVAEAAAGAPSRDERLRRLCMGLREIRFAQTTLHEDVKHLDLLVETVDAGGVGAQTVELWLRKLDDALNAGQLRAELVYAFGALLEEWARSGERAEHISSRSQEERQRLIAQLRAPVEPTRHQQVFDEVFGALENDLDRAAPKLKEAFEARENGLRPSLLTLEHLSRDIYQSPDLRDEARRFSTGDLHRDFADAIRLMVAELAAWDWPTQGVESEAIWTRNKWRLYPRPDLPTACLLGEVAELWANAFEQCFGEDVHVANRRQRLQKLRELNAPEVIIANEIRMLRQAEERVILQTVEPADPWQAFDHPADTIELEAGSVVMERFERQLSARSFRQAGDYDTGYGGASWSVLLTHAEVQLARAAFPDLPVYVLKADLKDFFNSIPHAVLLDLLERLRVPAHQRSLVARFLAFPLRSGGVDHGRAARGVPMGFQLSGFLANLLLKFLERCIFLEARVRIVREVDDITILAPTGEAVLLAWRRLREFCDACGLHVNQEKCGAVCIGPGELPEGLPARLPTWGMLQLDEHGRWGVYEAAFEAHLAQAREQVESERAILSQVQKYNANARFLEKALAATVDLGDAHQQAVLQAVRRHHLHFFEERGGVAAALAQEIRRRFFDNAAVIPEGWIHWPVTAGGLGLRNPILEFCQYAPRLASRPKPRERKAAPSQREPGWNLRNNPWAEFYRDLITELEPALPLETPQTKALLQDFIERGKTVSGGKQRDLSPYWRWVLAIYGPEILERLGTFRFLITELVPLQLIGRQLIRDQSLGEEDANF